MNDRFNEQETETKETFMSTNSTKTLAGKVALVTGGSRSIGAAIAKRLATDGAAVALTYSASADKANEVVRSIEAAGGKALAIKADAADTEAVWLAVAKTIGTFGAIVSINRAGLDVVNGDAARAEVSGKSLRESRDRCLRKRIDRTADEWHASLLVLP